MRAYASIVAAVLASLWLGVPVALAVVEVTGVRHAPDVIDPARGIELTVHYAVTEPARVELEVYDARDHLVRRLETDGFVSEGSHSFVWDGRDAKGDLVSPEAYHYVVRATGRNADRYTVDLTDETGRARMEPKDVRWDAEAGVVRFRLDESARATVRIGLLGGGPILATLGDWLPRRDGMHAIPWDGRDRSGVVDLRDHPNLGLAVIAYPLTANAVIVDGEGGPRRLSPKKGDGEVERRPSKAVARFGELTRKSYARRSS